MMQCVVSNATFWRDGLEMARRTSGGAVSSPKRRPVTPPEKKRSGRRILAIASALFLLYVLSSGPALSLAFTWHQPTVHDNGDGDLGVTINLDEGPWWPVVYAPLQWVSEQSWGDSLCWYWEFFPIPSDR
jgi:hypothetical protein